MDREITVELTPRLIRWTLFYQLRILFFILFVLVPAWSAGFLYRIPWGAWNWQSLVTPILALLAFLWILFSAYRNSMAQVRKMKTPFVHYRFTDDFLYVRSDLASGQNRWAVFKELRKHPRIWRIITPQGTSMVLPAELLDGDLKAFLSAKLPKGRGKLSLFNSLALWILLAVVAVYFFKQESRPKAAPPDSPVDSAGELSK